jgi:hypothetical protein
VLLVGIGPSSWGNVMEMKTNGSIGGDGLNLELGSGSGHFRKSCGFTIFQLQELQLQTLIYKHMGAGLPVPYHLLLPIWKSVESSLVGPNGVLPPVYTSCKYSIDNILHGLFFFFFFLKVVFSICLIFFDFHDVHEI